MGPGVADDAPSGAPTGYLPAGAPNGREMEAGTDPVGTNDGRDAPNTEGLRRPREVRDRPGLQSRPAHPPPPVERQAKAKKKVGASLRIASENIRGRGAPKIAGSLKWKALADDIRRFRIGVMALQETHMSDAHLAEVHQFYDHLVVVNSPLPSNPTGAGGVALVFNKTLTNSQEITHRVLIPGRAIAARLKWNRDDDLTILAVYAPTSRAENHEMWETVLEKLLEEDYDLPMPDVMMGDFNFVEDAIDRFPARISPMDAPETFTRLKALVQMQDGWRVTFPDSTEWTWRSSDRTSMSRIDRVYMTRRVLLTSRNWRTELSGLTKDDHSRVIVEIVNPDMPVIGPGRWAMPIPLSRDRQFLDEVVKMGAQAHRDMQTAAAEAPWTAQSSPQAVWARFKKDVATLARKRTKEIAGMRAASLRTKIGERDVLRSTLAAQGRDGHGEHADTQATLSQLTATEKGIQLLREQAHKSIFAHRDAKTRDEAEKMSKSWFRWTKTRRPRDTITALRRTNSDPPSYATNSAEMAALAKEYHDGIQSADTRVRDAGDDDALELALQHVKRRLSDEDAGALAAQMSEPEVLAAIKAAKAGSAPGLDGLVYELWKELARKHASEHEDADESFDVVAAMTLVFNDVEEHGVAAGTTFAQGWLCPIYKKGERSDIANYRPITLLNTDYKLFTKAIASRLALVAPSLIHPAQAGFMRGRSITAHSKISSLMLAYAEATGENGMIVALDQEKAYDKVHHAYLYAVLERFGFPAGFTGTVRALYTDAETKVMVNGIASKGYRVTRGVRQGDPLSCLLFNLAIEPLAEMLRGSTLRGFVIPGLAEKLIATLYADDMTVYLSENDSYQTMQELLAVWCKASGAKFNIRKTEIIPLGRAPYRERLLDSRCLHSEDTPVPDGIRIAKDGETTRILGTWPGNKVSMAAAWSLAKDRIADSLSRWELKHPTLNGRSILTHTVVGGMTQYLTAAQGMPVRVEKALDSMILDFFWGHARRRPVNMQTLRLPKSLGGAGVLHVGARNDAQYLTWLSEFLAPTGERPIWAYLADAVFQSSIIQRDALLTPSAQRSNPFEQGWRPNLRRLPFILQCLVRTARRYNLVMDAPEIPARVREQMHVWSHPAMLENDIWRGTGWQTRCLRTHHEVRTVEDLEEIAEIDDSAHSDSSGCVCENCATDRRHGCRHPHRCQNTASEILGSIAEKWNPSTTTKEDGGPLAALFEDSRDTALHDGELIVFDDEGARAAQRADLFRFCVDSLSIDPKSAQATLRAAAPQRADVPAESLAVQVIICAAVRGGQAESSTASFALRYPDADCPDVAHRCTDQPGSYAVAMSLGILWAVQSAAPHATLHIVTPAKAVVKALTTGLAQNVAEGWLSWPGAEREMRTVAAALRARVGETTFLHVDRKRARGWPEITETRAAAKMAAHHADGERLATLAGRFAGTGQAPDAWLSEFDVPGISIRGLGQRSAHRAIRKATECKQEPRWTTLSNVDNVKASIESLSGARPSTHQIWRGLRSPDFSRTARNFLWKTMHGAHKVGDYFAHMPEPWREKRICPACGDVESMEHILFRCTDSGQHIVWPLAREALRDSSATVPDSLGGVLGVALLRIKASPRGWDRDAERELRIVVSEAAFLIWKLRCKRRIEHGDEDWHHTHAEVASQWETLLAARKAQDAIIARRRPPKTAPGSRGERSSDRQYSAEPPNYAELMYGPGVLVSLDQDLREGVG